MTLPSSVVTLRTVMAPPNVIVDVPVASVPALKTAWLLFTQGVWPDAPVELVVQKLPEPACHVPFATPETAAPVAVELTSQ